MRAQGQHLAGVRVGGPGLGVQVVTVVPEHHQAEIMDRGEHRGAGTGDHPDQAPADRQPAAVAFGRPEVRGQADVDPRAGGGQRGVDAFQVPGIGHHDDRAPAVVAAATAISVTQCGPGKAVQPARTGRPSARPARNAPPAG